MYPKNKPWTYYGKKSEKELMLAHKTRYKYVQYKNTIKMRPTIRLYLDPDGSYT